MHIISYEFVNNCLVCNNNNQRYDILIYQLYTTNIYIITLFYYTFCIVYKTNLVIHLYNHSLIIFVLETR